MVTITIVGRPNVGKSTLFNALVGLRMAITDHKAGTTRDLNERDINLTGDDGKDYPVKLIDSGGLGIIDEPDLASRIEHLISKAIDEADIIVLVTDVRTGITDLDQMAAARMKRLKKPILLVVNKCETQEWDMEAHVFRRLGLGDPIPIAAQDGRNLRDLTVRLIEIINERHPGEGKAPVKVEEPAEEEDEDLLLEGEPLEEELNLKRVTKEYNVRRPGPMRLAVLGRRNVGKSTFVNAVAGEERCIVSEIPGTTRDSIDVEIGYGGEKLVIIDTAGIVRHREGKQTVEFKSSVRTERAIRRADVVLLMIDATLSLGKLERDASRLAREGFKPTIVIINKWDLSTVSPDTYIEYLDKKLRFTAKMPVIFVSAINKEGVDEAISTARELFEYAGRKLGTGILNRAVAHFVEEHGTPVLGTKAAKIYYAVQTGIYPPEFTFFVNYPEAFNVGFLKYLERRLAAELGSEELPVLIKLRAHGRAKRRMEMRRGNARRKT